MEIMENPDDLQKAANYRSLRKILRPAGIGSIVFGLIAILAGAPGMNKNIIDAALALIGLFLFLEGLWIVSAPTPAGMAVDGIALIVLGLYNISSTVYDMSQESVGAGRGFIMLGLWQVIWGLQRFGRYKHFARLPMEKPSVQVMKWLDSIARSITRAGTAETSDLIALEIDAEKKKQPWRGLLTEKMGIFVEGSGHQVIFARRENVDISMHGETGAGGLMKASFQIGEQTSTGTISPEYLDRYERWKRSPREEVPAELAGVRLADSINWDTRAEPAKELKMDLQSVRYAGFWRRCAAAFVDTIVLSASVGAAMYLVLFVMFAILATLGNESGDMPPKWDAAVDSILLFVLIIVPWLYSALMESSRKQASLGKLALRIAVIDSQGNRIPFWKATGRHFGKIVSGALLFVGFVMAGVTERKQALHDMMAGCLVVDRRQRVTDASVI